MRHSFDYSASTFLPVREADYAGLPVADAFKSISEKRGVQPLPESVKDALLPLNGQMISSPHAKDAFEPVPLIAANPRKYFSAHADNVGHYNVNNGTLAVVANDGNFLIGRASSTVVAAIENAGYRKNEMHVPLSNGERFVSPSCQAVFEDLAQRQRLESKLTL